MSGSYRPPGNRVSGQEYWAYLPTHHHLSDHLVPTGTSLNPRGRKIDPWGLFEETSIREPSYGCDSFLSEARGRASIPLLIDDMYPSRYNQAFAEEESRLSMEEQKRAVNKLRKQLYSPHISSIIKRLGTKSPGSSVKQDEDGKRCAVCLDDFENKQFVTLTPCNHMFHEDCIVPWVKSHGKCPVCRFVIF